MSFQTYFVHQTFILTLGPRPGMETHKGQGALAGKSFDLGGGYIWL